MEKNENIYRSRGKMLFNNFLGGIAWSIGVWFGTIVIVAIFGYFISKINFVPIVGNFVAEISKYVASHSTPFHF